MSTMTDTEQHHHSSLNGEGHFIEQNDEMVEWEYAFRNKILNKNYNKSNLIASELINSYAKYKNCFINKIEPI